MPAAAGQVEPPPGAGGDGGGDGGGKDEDTATDGGSGVTVELLIVRLAARAGPSTQYYIKVGKVYSVVCTIKSEWHCQSGIDIGSRSEPNPQPLYSVCY